MKMNIRDNDDIKNRNNGSTVIEMTLMIPVILGCIYFYIMSMLYLVEHGRVVDKLSEELYESISYENISVDADDSVYRNALDTSAMGDSEYDRVSVISAAATDCVNNGVADYEEDYERYKISVKLKVDDCNPVKSLRRWQLIADTIR